MTNWPAIVTLVVYLGSTTVLAVWEFALIRTEVKVIESKYQANSERLDSLDEEIKIVADKFAENTTKAYEVITRQYAVLTDLQVQMAKLQEIVKNNSKQLDRIHRQQTKEWLEDNR